MNWGQNMQTGNIYDTTVSCGVTLEPCDHFWDTLLLEYGNKYLLNKISQCLIINWCDKH